MKEKYETPECEVIEFETEDVITTSNPLLGEGGNEEDQFQYMIMLIIGGGSNPASMYERERK